MVRPIGENSLETENCAVENHLINRLDDTAAGIENADPGTGRKMTGIRMDIWKESAHTAGNEAGAGSRCAHEQAHTEVRQTGLRRGLLLIAAAALVSAGGCAHGEAIGKRGMTNYGAKSDHIYGSQLGRGDDGMKLYGSSATSGPVIHANTRLVYSQSLSDKVTDVRGVNTAIVLLTNNNAYAALMLDHTATGTKGPGAKRELNNSGTSVGRYYPHASSNVYDSDYLTYGSNSYDTVERPDDLTHALKQEVAATIRRAHPAVQEVYITANRDFVNHMYRLARESWLGRPIDGHVNEFNAMVNGIFGKPDREPPRVPGK